MDSEHIKEVTIEAAVITVSTTRDSVSDSSGALIRDLLTQAGIRISYYAVIPDQIPQIRGEFFTALKKANCIIFNGGTGLTHDDCTIEAIAPLLEKRMDGFGEIFRHLSLEQVGTAAILSRALAGVTCGKAIFCIPGSNGAVTLATSELIIPQIRHIVTHALR